MICKNGSVLKIRVSPSHFVRLGKCPSHYGMENPEMKLNGKCSSDCTHCWKKAIVQLNSRYFVLGGEDPCSSSTTGW